MNNILKQHAQTLHLSGLLDSLQLRLQEAEANRLPYTQFLELLFQDEINVRHQLLINRRYKQAEFRELRSLENFDFSFNLSINRALIYELATGQFVAQRRDVLLVGPPGVGKSHLVQAIGRQVLKVGFRVLYRSIFDLVRELLSQESQLSEGQLLKKYLKPDLLIIDDMGLKILPQKSGEIFLELIMRRYENRSTMMTSNRPIEEWGKLLSDVPAASAILDRLLHHAEIIAINGRSYRLQPKAKRAPAPELRILQFKPKVAVQDFRISTSNLHFFSSLSRFSKNRGSGFCWVRASAYHRKSGPRPSFLGASIGRPGRRVPGGNRPTLHPRAEHLSALAQPQDRHAWRLRLLGSTQRPAKNRSGPERLHVTLRIIWPRILPTIWHHREGILFGGRPWLLGSNLRDH
jgi:DNA replication protein DnaC